MKKSYNIYSEKSILTWDRALPLGNGRMGCLIYGDGEMRFALDRIDLWDKRRNSTTLEDGFNNKHLVELVKDGSNDAWNEYLRLFNNIYREKAYPSKITAGRMILDFGVRKDDIKSTVDLSTANATIDILDKEVHLEAFVSAVDKIGVVKIYGEYSVDLHIPEYISAFESSKTFGYPRASIIKEDNYIYFDQHTHTDLRYGIVVLKKEYADYSELYFTVASNTDNDDYIEKAKAELLKASEVGYDALKSRHAGWWKKYWSRSNISIGDALLEKTYYRSWYLFASCSRKGGYPMPLQGVWTADNDEIPPWKGDYHHDTNTQLSYQAYLKANHLDEGEVFIDYLWKHKSEFYSFARDFFGVDGILIPAVSSIDGYPMGGWPQYSLSPTMTIWAAQSFDEYYLYTGNEKFLREKAYPFFYDVATAIKGLLEEQNEKLYLPLSTSPEIHDNKREAYLEPNSNFDLALLRYLFKTLIRYENHLGYDSTEYERILSKLDDVAVHLKKGIMLDKNQTLDHSHRHFSHVMCMYPLHLINYDTDENKKIYNDTLSALEWNGTGEWVGFSFAMSAQIYAMARRGNSAYERLYQFANGFVEENGFHLNGDFKKMGYSWYHYRPFTLEASFGFCDALHEMLLQDHMGYIDIFPAVPDDWMKKKISFRNLRSRNGILVSATLVNGHISNLRFYSHIKTGIKFKIPNFNDKVISLELSEGTTVISGDDFYNR